MARAVYMHHPSSLQHDTGAHPERAARLLAIERELERRNWLGFDRVSAPAIERAVLEAVHPSAYVDSIQALSAGGGGWLDVDTVASEGSYEAALHAAGGAAALVDALLRGDADVGFCALRPPGHHAEAARAMGFCLFNNVAVAARRALDEHGLRRVLILDWDVHHGNGTNDIFHASAAVLYASIHQSPLYPGTGAADDVGSGAGAGYTLNLPVPPGSGDETFVSLVEHVVVPVARAYAPQLVLVSAGYDAHEDDPLANCRVSDDGYARMAAATRRLSEQLGAPLGVVLEGGYDLDALARSVARTLEAIGAPSEPSAPPELAEHPLAAAARRRLSAHWDLATQSSSGA